MILNSHTLLANNLVGFGEQTFLKLFLSCYVRKGFLVIILDQDPVAVFVHDHEPLHRVQGRLQQHIV